MLTSGDVEKINYKISFCLLIIPEITSEKLQGYEQLS